MMQTQKHFSLGAKLSAPLMSAILAQVAYASPYKVACYYQDIDTSNDNRNSELMMPSKLYALARSNYYWALDKKSHKVELNGDIVDGFFVENGQTYEDVVESCKRAIQKGTFFYPTQPTYRLYDFKASQGDSSSAEYPIVFPKAAVQTQSTSQVDRIVVFGDSLSDDGNLKRWLKMMPFFPYWFGRFSDGPVWNEYVSYYTRIPILNFAYGGAKTEGTNDKYLNLVPSSIAGYLKEDLRNQATGNSKDYIMNYLNQYLTDDSYRTEKSSVSRPESTLYTLWIGANDFDVKYGDDEAMANFFQNPYSLGGSMFVGDRAAENVLEQGYMLLNAGAQNLMIIGLPDMGKAPLLFDLKYQFSSDETQNIVILSQKLTEITQHYNDKLAAAVAELKTKFPTAHVEFLDINEMLRPMFAETGITKFQFDRDDSGIVIHDQGISFPLQKHCNSTGFVEGFFKVGANRSNRFMEENHCLNQQGQLAQRPMFWNSAHPSSYSHCLLSYFMMSHFSEVGFISAPLPKLAEYQKMCKDFGERRYADFDRFASQ